MRSEKIIKFALFHKYIFQNDSISINVLISLRIKSFYVLHCCKMMDSYFVVIKIDGSLKNINSLMTEY